MILILGVGDRWGLRPSGVLLQVIVFSSSCSGRVCERRPPGSREVQVLPQRADGHVRQPSAVAPCGQRGTEGNVSTVKEKEDVCPRAAEEIRGGSQELRFQKPESEHL